jgi:hypothetical protein
MTIMGLLFLPQVIYEHGKPWRNDIDMGKLLIRPPELSDKAISSHLVANQEGVGEGNNKFSLRSISFSTSK